MTYLIEEDGMPLEKKKARPWEQLIELKDDLIKILETHCVEYTEPGMDRFNNPEFGWVNKTYRNSTVRRAHIDVVDVRGTKKLWMMHICVFPKISNPGPIYGFDVIAGQNKVTGAFHDFSPLLQKDHELTQWFIDNTKHYVPSKKRELPEWALKIFSPGMIAASNVQLKEELHDICNLAKYNLEYYLKNINKYHGTANEEEVIKAQNYYCQHQRQNPHTPRVMESLGLPAEDIKIFCKDNLFPDIRK